MIKNVLSLIVLAGVFVILAGLFSSVGGIALLFIVGIVIFFICRPGGEGV